MFKARLSGDFNLDRMEKRIQTLIRDVGRETLKTAKNITPVRSGRARDNWTKQTTRTGFEVENSVPYIGHLDKGSSRQAPRGISKPTVRKVAGYMKNRSRRITR